MDLVGLVGMSHSPSWDLGRTDGPARDYVEAVFAARAAVARAAPDLLVVFGPDHVRNFFFDLMPAFCIGVDQVAGFGDFGSPKGPLPTSPSLAASIAETVLAAGFDPALSYNMGIDHGISQPIQVLAPDLSTPVLPIMISSSGDPLPTLTRCHAFGEAVGAAIRSLPGDGRVVVVGSGGLSHSPPSLSPTDPMLSPETRDYVINGRARVQQFNAEREESSRNRRLVGGTGPINQEWDHWLLSCMRSGDLAPVLALDNAAVLADGGVGGQEVRAWMAALGAWGGRADTAAYSPVPTWITGMACITAFKEELS
jgi:2,3-dihydroxyphenylpropionate 1,2-dioxygenase